MPLTAGIIAVPSKDPGYSPFSLIEQLRRNLAHPQAAFDAIASAEPIDAGSLIKGLRAGLDRAEREIEKMPPSAIGFLYRDKGRVVTPTQDNIQSLVELAPSRRGVLGEPHAVRMADAQTALGWQADIGDQGR